MIAALFGLGTNWHNCEKLQSADKERLKNKLERTLRELKARHHQNELFWAQIESTVLESLINRKKTSVVMFVSDLDTRQLAEKLINDILSSISQYVTQREVSLFGFIKK